MELGGGNMDVSIIIIFDKIRKRKLQRLFNSMKDELSLCTFSTEVLLVHESSAAYPPKKDDLPIPVRYINVTPKQGIPFNRNRGIDAARGDILVFIDDDCWVQPQWLRSLVQPLLDDPSLYITTSGTKIPSSNIVGDSISALGFPGGGSLGFTKVWKVSKEGFTNHLAAGNCAMRRSLLYKVGTFDETMKSGAEDAELSFRIENASIPIKYVENGFAYHEARSTFSSFVKWQLRRGKANYQFKQKVGSVSGFIKLRLWSAKNILVHNIMNWRLPLIFFFLGLSFVLQQVGFLMEKRRH